MERLVGGELSLYPVGDIPIHETDVIQINMRFS